MNILIVNAGSSSLKFQLIKADETFETLYEGIVDGIGRASCFFTASAGTKSVTYKKRIPDHAKALNEAVSILFEFGVIKSLKEIDAVGHRVVHGGEKYTKATKLTVPVVRNIEAIAELAPLHNPANLQGIYASMEIITHAPHIAIFDTAFHQTLPEKAYKYALPEDWYKDYHIRKYGFHGTNHKYIAHQTYTLIGKNKGKIITCHLGNGSSISAIKDNVCVETSMGFTPLEGIPMGTRSGSIDPAIPLYMMDKLKIDSKKMDTILNKNSGILAISDLSSDVRDIWERAQKNNKKALYTLEKLAYEIALKIGAYAAAMDGLDAITFTAGIGENAWYLRRDICSYLNHLGVKLDSRKNRSNAAQIQDEESKVKIFVIKANEGKQMAREVFNFLNK
ncbi:acetate kinase [bacterium]|nr:acetate kinase [bacterium]